MLIQAGLTSAEFGLAVHSTIADGPGLHHMAERAMGRGRPAAAAQIVDRILALVSAS